MNIRDYFAVPSHVATTTNMIVGLECEVEDLRGSYMTIPPGSYWNCIEDGSLRNNGREYVSIPMSKNVAAEQFNKLHNWLQYQTADVSSRFSERTSVHVHVNCLSLEPEQVRSIILYYALFEPFFFSMVAPHRANNIHCVALNQTHLSKYYNKELSTLKTLWSKYTALNILPLAKYGTLEFRHMQGTDDQKLMEEWLNTLENLWLFGQNNLISKETVMNDETIALCFESIFKDSKKVLSQRDTMMATISDSLIDIKLRFVQGKS